MSADRLAGKLVGVSFMRSCPSVLEPSTRRTRRRRRQRLRRWIERSHRRVVVATPVEPKPVYRAALVCYRITSIAAANSTQWTVYPSRADAELALTQPCTLPGCLGSHGIACLDRYANVPIVTERARLSAVDDALNQIVAQRRRLG